MRKKVTLEVEDSTGMIYDETGIYIGTKLGIRGFEPEGKRLSIAEIIKRAPVAFMPMRETCGKFIKLGEQE